MAGSLGTDVVVVAGVELSVVLHLTLEVGECAAAVVEHLIVSAALSVGAELALLAVGFAVEYVVSVAVVVAERCFASVVAVGRLSKTFADLLVVVGLVLLVGFSVGFAVLAVVVELILLVEFAVVFVVLVAFVVVFVVLAVVVLALLAVFVVVFVVLDVVVQAVVVLVLLV